MYYNRRYITIVIIHGEGADKMPPKPKITRQMVIDAAFKIAKESGIENINARTVANELGCSTQPVMYHFKTIEDLKKAVIQKADEYHTDYIMSFSSDDPMLDIGLNYIRFATLEKMLFRLLFQSDELSGKSITDLISPESVSPLLGVLSQEAEVDIEQAENIFLTLALFVHGYASLLANNSLEYDEKTVLRQLENVYNGAVYTAKGGNHE